MSALKDIFSKAITVDGVTYDIVLDKPKPTEMSLTPGDKKHENGREYTLNKNHRWERSDGGEGSSGAGVPAAPTAPTRPSAVRSQMHSIPVSKAEVLSSIQWQDSYRNLYPGAPGEDNGYEEEYWFDSKEQAEEYADMVVGIFEGLPDPVPVYRAVHAAEPGDVRTGEFAGESWSFDRRSAEQFGSHNGSNYLISGVIPKSKVDWQTTISNYVEFSGFGADSEDEIVIPYGEQAQDVSVSRLGEKEHPEVDAVSRRHGLGFKGIRDVPKDSNFQGPLRIIDGYLEVNPAVDVSKYIEGAARRQVKLVEGKEDLVAHELGHIAQAKAGVNVEAFWLKAGMGDNLFRHVFKSEYGEYGLTNKEEFFAECFRIHNLVKRKKENGEPVLSQWQKTSDLVESVISRIRMNLTPGDKKHENGHEYTLNQNHRWERSDGGEGSSGAVVPAAPSPSPPTATKQFKAWFGKSKVVDENGAPMRLFHGTNQSFDTFGKSTNIHAKALGLPVHFFTTDADLSAAYSASANHEGDGFEQTVPVYLKMENPLVIEANGKDWTEVLSGDYGNDNGLLDMIETWRTPAEKEFREYRNSLASKYAYEYEYEMEFELPDDERDKLSKLAQRFEDDLTGASGVRAKDIEPQGVIGYDGIIIKGVWDRPPLEHEETATYSPYTDVYAVFDPTHIKSAIGSGYDGNDPRINMSSDKD